MVSLMREVHPPFVEKVADLKCIITYLQFVRILEVFSYQLYTYSVLIESSSQL